MSKRSVSASVAITTIGNALPPIVGVVTAPLLALSLGVVGRGELAAITAPLLLAVNLATLGLPDALTYFSARRGENFRRLVIGAAIALGLAGIVCSVAIYLLSGVLSAGDQSLARYISLAGIAVSPSLILAGLRGIASGFEAWWLVTIEKIVNSGLRLILIVSLALANNLNLETGAVVMVFTTFIGIVVYAWLPMIARRDAREIIAEPVSMRRITSFGARVWLGSLTGILLSRLDQTLMVPLSGSYELGLYAVAVTISEMTLVFNAAVATVIFARESRQQDADRLASATRISSLVTVAACLGVGLVSIWALPFFFGNDFTPALPTLWILLLAVAVGNPGSVAGAGLNARGRPGLRSMSLAIALVINVVVMVLLVPVLGSLGAGLATLAGNFTAGMLNLVWLRVHFGIPVWHFLGIRRSDFVFLLSILKRRK